MNIGFDIRKYDDFGIGTYIRNVLGGIPSYPSHLNWTLLGSPGKPAPDVGLGADFYHYEMLSSHRRNPFQGHLSCSHPLDIFFAPHYLTPDPGPVRFLLTIHDLIHLDPPVPPARIPRIGSLFDRLKESLKRRYHIGLARSKFVERVDAAEIIISVSQATADHLELLLPGSFAKTVVIPNCVDSVFFDIPDSSTIDAFKSRFNETNRPYFAYCGNDLFHKNIGYLLMAWKQISESLKDPPRLLLAGPPRVEAIELAIQRLRLESSVRLMNRMSISDIHLFISCAEGLIMPSLAEGFGLPVAEAMASGVAVACSDIRPHREITGDHAAFFNPQDVASGVSTLKRFVSETTLRSELVDAARKHASRYHPTIFIQHMSELLDHIR